MSHYKIVKIQCSECERVTVVRVWEGGDDLDLLEAGVGEFVERGCGNCEKETDHTVITDAVAVV